MKTSKQLTAIDLYSGIGGWTLGLAMSGIPSLLSFDFWEPANETHRANFPSARVLNRNIRELDFEELPEPGSVDILVGSPPCTQFSFSNRGGNGDLDDGLLDIRKFLEIVEYLRPRFWAMENVPRVAEILGLELRPTGRLHRFAPLFTGVEVLSASAFGLPQNRDRMIAGHLPFDLLYQYSVKCKRRTLGDVLEALAGDPVVDPIYGSSIARDQVSEMETEPCLTSEELRMNKDAKLFHPVYNCMAFPDEPDRPSRTVTATCTRVSRESIVISDPLNAGQFRRLTIRERACLQGFPITYQFYGRSASAKMKMIGNAIPPVLTYFIAEAMKGTTPGELRLPEFVDYMHPMPSSRPARTLPKPARYQYPVARRFRGAIPNLRFGSGVGFDLSNAWEDSEPVWRVSFFYGTSKAIMSIVPDAVLVERLIRMDLLDCCAANINAVLSSVRGRYDGRRPDELQGTWNHSSSGMHPFQVLDELGQAAKQIELALRAVDDSSVSSCVLAEISLNGPGPGAMATGGAGKIIRCARWILSGLLVGGTFNSTTISRSSALAHRRFF